MLKFDSSGRPEGSQLIDLGLACQKDSGSFHEQCKSQDERQKRIVASPWVALELYAAPLGKRVRNGIISDVYSVGHLMFRLLDRMSESFEKKKELRELMLRCKSEEPACRMSLSFLLSEYLKPMLEDALGVNDVVSVILK